MSEIEEKKDEMKQGVGIRPIHKMRRTKTFLKIGSPVTTAIMISVLLVGASLIGLIWTNYGLYIQGDIDLNGAEEEPISILYDDVLLLGNHLTVTTMDYAELNPGDELTTSHTWDNIDGHGFWLTYDLSNMPLEYVDVNDIWYGFVFEVREHGTTNKITAPVYLDPYTDLVVDYYYDLDGMFAEPGMPFPFNVTVMIELYDQPDAVDDVYDLGGQMDYTLTVLDNDFVGDGVTITAVTQTGVGGQLVTINPGAQTLNFYTNKYITSTFTYTISDGFTSDTATVTVTSHA